MAASEMSKGSATSVTAMSSSKSMAKMARRVGSARAAKVVSSEGAMGDYCDGRRQSSTGWLNDAFGSGTGCVLGLRGATDCKIKYFQGPIGSFGAVLPS